MAPAELKMIKLHDGGVYLLNGETVIPESDVTALPEKLRGEAEREAAKKGTIAHSIISSHNVSGDDKKLRLHFDALASHDITFVGIIQTAKASGMESFPLPYVLTNCHNTLCAVGGTINEDDHVFGLSAAKKYGGIYVPPHIAVIHQYMREMHAGCGKMILGSDSHTRYGALGTMAIGEGGGELVKQLLKDTYDVDYPGVVLVYLTGSPKPFVGPQDVALAIIKAVFQNGYVKNKVMEFAGPGVASMSTDYRNGVDVMTTETTCLSSIWKTDEDTKAFLTAHGRRDDYRELKPAEAAYYDGCIEIDLSEIKPMIALPFHPSNVYSIDELNENLEDILAVTEKDAEKVAGGRASFTLRDKIENGRLRVQQGVIAGCAGGNYTNVIEAAHALKGKSTGDGEFALSVYPSSQAVFVDLLKKGAITDLMEAGAIIRSAFCGPCFGAGDTPANNGLSIRHTTRNFPNREGSKPGNAQMAAVALMDARSIAATAARGGILTSAEEFDGWGDIPEYIFDGGVYEKRVYNGFGKATGEELIYGPNIKDWPEMSKLSEKILLKVCSKIMDPVTTTDELIPSGETSSYRSNPLGLAEFTLSRRDPEYVGRSKEVDRLEKARVRGENPAELSEELKNVYAVLAKSEMNMGERTGAPKPDAIVIEPSELEIGSVIYAVKPGDGSAREQAASCQRVLGGLANITKEYATKRYRSNCINWGMLPFRLEGEPEFEVGDYIYVPGVRSALREGKREFAGLVLRMKGGKVEKHDTISLVLDELTEEEREIIMAGSLINKNRERLSEN